MYCIEESTVLATLLRLLGARGITTPCPLVTTLDESDSYLVGRVVNRVVNVVLTR